MADTRLIALALASFSLAMGGATTPGTPPVAGRGPCDADAAQQLVGRDSHTRPGSVGDTPDRRRNAALDPAEQGSCDGLPAQ